MFSSRRELVSWLFFGLFRKSPNGGNAPPPAPRNLADQVKDLTEKLERLREVVNHLTVASPPVGAVQAFAGPWTPDPVREARLGWLLCDGRPLDQVERALRAAYPDLGRIVPDGGILRDLRSVLPAGAKELPNYLGCFLRGADPTASVDPEGKGRLLGAFQADGVKSHAHPVTLGGGAHCHVFEYQPLGKPDNGFGNGACLRYVEVTPATRTTQTDGEHTHSGTTNAEGGPETRPRNRTVHFLIKYR